MSRGANSSSSSIIWRTPGLAPCSAQFERAEGAAGGRGPVCDRTQAAAARAAHAHRGDHLAHRGRRPRRAALLARRFPAGRGADLSHGRQGAAAPAELVAALELAAARAECDVLILARGGGSLEDLWAFNDERVARAMSPAPIPVVTGIGHEIDFTIADFVADVRAPTPSGAAELVTPDGRAWLHRLAQLGSRFAAGMRRHLQHEHTRFAGLMRRLQQAHPGVRLSHYSQRLDELEGRLQFALQAGLAAQVARVESAARALQGVSPLATLGRGFAVITRSSDGALVNGGRDNCRSARPSTQRWRPRQPARRRAGAHTVSDARACLRLSSGACR